MGKNNKSWKRKKNKGASPQRNNNKKKKSAAAPPPPLPPKELATPSATPLPLPFPSGLDIPKNSFLRNEEPYQQSFQTALDTCYEGFAVDNPASVPIKEETVQSALNRLENLGFFRTDVTQPFGLGTKCAKTYVTRCLLGDQGTTYKYLGLRMFSHPWNEKDGDDAAQVIHQLNETLTKRTQHHLSELAGKRSKRGGGSTEGRAGFDICLVNRMEPSADLKDEPSIGFGKCAVSWHADSSLEHYSTIAVYQTIVNEKKGSANKDWSVALRVAHHAEGPEASRRGTDIQSTLVTDTPTVSVSLPSGSAYYLLDDFNHHHQHAVISEGSSHNVRYSCTHRLLRQSHNVTHILERCQKTCSLFHKKGTKIWRPEQVLLTEIESEWIRQFYIQGKQHHDLLWKHWGDSMQQLFRYWSQLEARTKQTIDFLQSAAEARCGIESSSDGQSKVDRKTRNKRKKALDALEELVSRIGMARTTAIQSLYEPLAELLRERAEMRRLWKKREDDHVFRELDRSQRPLPVPFEFGVDTKSSGDCSAVSPLPEDLLALADRVVALGRACVSGDPTYLPADYLSSSSDTKPTTTEDNKSVQNDHCQSLSWQGWNDRQFGLEMQSPWAGLLLQGRKTIETRAYDLPPALLGKRIEILQSKQGSTVSSLGNVVRIAEEDPAVTRVGWCTFTHVIRYSDFALFDADQDAHWVTKESDFYPFKKGSKTNVVYGWVVGEVGLSTNETCSLPLKAIVRRYRSLFELDNSNSKQVGSTSNKNKRKKRRRY